MKPKAPKYSYDSKKYIDKNTGMSFSEALIFQDIELHWHDFFELEIVLDGKPEHILNGRKSTISRGSFFFARLTDFHMLKPDPCVHIYKILLDERKFSQIILNISSKVDNSLSFKLNEDDLVVVENLFKLCQKEKPLP